MTPGDDDELVREDGVKIARCDDDRSLPTPSPAEQIVLSAFFKDQLDAAIREAATAGWRVRARSHCSETGRHGAKLFRLVSDPNDHRQGTWALASNLDAVRSRRRPTRSKRS